MSLCHYGLVLSSYVRGISVITPLPLLPFGQWPLVGGWVGEGGSWWVWLLLLILSFLYRVPTIILWIFFLFSFFLFNFVPITKGIRTINKKDSANEATTELANTVFIVWNNDCHCTTSIYFCTFVLMWRNRDSCQPASYSLFVGRRWCFLF